MNSFVQIKLKSSKALITFFTTSILNHLNRRLHGNDPKMKKVQRRLILQFEKLAKSGRFVIFSKNIVKRTAIDKSNIIIHLGPIGLIEFKEYIVSAPIPMKTSINPILVILEVIFHLI